MRPLLLFLSLPVLAFSQQQGPNNPSSATTVPNSSCLSCPGNTWSQETNVFLADNNSSFTVLYAYPNCFQTNCYYSRYLYSSDFNFNVPLNATILGVQAEVNRNPGNPNVILDSTVKLFDGVSMIGTNEAGLLTWPNGFNYAVYGGSASLWGATLTPAIINGAGFGLYFKPYNSSTNVIATVAVDHVRMTVWYSTPTGISNQTAVASDFQAGINRLENKLWFVFSARENSKMDISISDLTGKALWSANGISLPSGKNKQEFSIPSLNSGIYFVRMQSGSLVRTQKVAVE